MTLDIDIESGSGDVTIDTSASRNVFIDAAVGEITVKSKGDNLSINSVSGDINIEGVFKNTEIDTVSSDAKMYAGSDTNQICYESVSGDATIYTHGVRGYVYFPIRKAMHIDFVIFTHRSQAPLPFPLGSD